MGLDIDHHFIERVKHVGQAMALYFATSSMYASGFFG
jgi:hypothetical protein